MTAPISIPLNKLTAWKGNVRKTAGADTALAELAASIAAHDLLQSLVVRKGKNDTYAVVAGGRRLAALQLLAGSGRISNDHAVSCRVIADDANATEISLAENAIREQMHRADQFEAFRDLTDKGMTVVDIAARFGVTDTVVEKRLKLARVSPVIVAAYRAGKLDLEQVMAFAITDDHKSQEKLFKVLRNIGDDPRSIRRALTDGEIPASHRIVKFVGIKAYEKADGQVRRDLFAHDDEGVFILDQQLLQNLAIAKLEKTASGVRKEGWKWVETRLEQDHGEWSHCGRVHPELAPLSPKLAKELAAPEQEFEQLATAWENNDDPPAEYPERLRELSGLIDEINEGREDVWLPESLAIAGAVVRIDYHGKTAIDRGYVLPVDRPKKVVPQSSMDDNGGDVIEVGNGETSTMSAALMESLTLHRTAALGAELINRPDIALAALVHTLAAQYLLETSSGDTCLEFSAMRKPLRGMEGTKAFDTVTSASEIWGDRIPATPDALWAWCLAQDQQVLLDLLAFCMARAVNAVRMKRDVADGPRLMHADKLALALKLDMTAWFTPTAENYFAKISRAGILDALSEAKRDIAPAWSKARKSDLAVIAERQMAGTGWLPALLRKAA